MATWKDTGAALLDLRVAFFAPFAPRTLAEAEELWRGGDADAAPLESLEPFSDCRGPFSDCRGPFSDCRGPLLLLGLLTLLFGLLTLLFGLLTLLFGLDGLLTLLFALLTLLFACLPALTLSLDCLLPLLPFDVRVFLPPPLVALGFFLAALGFLPLVVELHTRTGICEKKNVHLS